MSQILAKTASFATYWNYSRRALDVGHRGIGSTFHHGGGSNESVSASHSAESLDDLFSTEAPKENTLESLAEAASHGADLIEFDVQLTKDRVSSFFVSLH